MPIIQSRILEKKENVKYMAVLQKWSYISKEASLSGAQAWNRASGIIGESRRIFGREMYGIFVL